MKRIQKGFLLFLLISLCSIQTAAAASVKVTLNDNPLVFDTPPVVENGRVLVPMRGILEALGYSVGWQAHTQTVLAKKDGMDISLPLNSTTVTVNQETVTIDVPARLQDGRTLVPLRFLAEYSGAEVTWDGKTSTVIICSAETQDYSPADSVVYLQTNKMQGSGVILSEDGLIATNFHMIEKASIAHFIFNDGSIYQGKTTVVGLDPQKDIALLKIEKSGLTPARLSPSYKAGDAVMAIGSPHGIRNIITEGTITGGDQDIIVSTAVIDHGNSGGGLFLSTGELIGITSSFTTEEQYYAIPLYLVARVPRDLDVPLSAMQSFVYTPDAPQNLRYTKKGQYAYVSWSPVYGADHYRIYTYDSRKTTPKKLNNPNLKDNIWYWGYPQCFGISANSKYPYYIQISAVVDGVETPLSDPLKIS